MESGGAKVAMGVAAAGAAAAIVCGKACVDGGGAGGAGGGVVHIYRSPGLSPPKVVSTKRTCAQFGIAEAAITTVRLPLYVQRRCSVRV
jgi:hypothetical protein